MSVSDWFRAFSILKKQGVGFVVLFGGEPTLNNELPAMVSYLNSIEMPHTIITNGIRLTKDNEYYRRFVASLPYGISTSVNTLKAEDSFHDNEKSEVGATLLKRLKQDLPNCDLVANMAVTRKNIEELPNLVRHFTELNIWSILSFFHVCPPAESLHWWYRGPLTEDNKALVFESKDQKTVERIANIFIHQYDKFKLHNQKKYFEAWKDWGIKQNWRCHEWVCPAINPDGSLMACIDKSLIEPFSIFDLKDELSKAKLYDIFQRTIATCKRGCFWDHMWETNKYALENNSEIGKIQFAHKKKYSDENPNCTM
jgi:MoaA/NifB/PqqE/SkfB family radical SAM enzyme